MLSTSSLLAEIKILCVWIVLIQVHTCSSRSFQTSDLKAGVPTLGTQEYGRQDDSNHDLNMARADKSGAVAGRRAQCDAGWKHYNHHCYRIVQKSSERRNWKDAQATCVALGGNLLSILTSTEQAFIQHYLTQDGAERSYWIGLNCTGLEDLCRWQGMPTASPYNHRSNRVKEESVPNMCMEINMRTKFNGLWTSKRCDAKQRFICKKGVNNDVSVFIHSKCGISYHYDPPLSKQSSNRRRRVVDGTRADDYIVPWQAFIQVKRSDNITIRCGGSLIDQRFIVSAAHCFQDIMQKPQSIRIALGIVRLNDAEKDNKSWKVPVKRVTKKFKTHRYGEEIIYLSQRDVRIHPSYGGGCKDGGRCIIRDFNADIAIIKLPYPIQTNRYVRTLCMPDQKILNSNLGKLECRVSGWGNTRMYGYSSFPRYLRWAKVSILDSNKCNKTMAYRDNITRNMLCAGKWEGGVDTCQGDSGGPLMCRLPGKPWALMGITSAGRDCAQPMAPGIYTSLNSPAIADWVNRSLKQ